MFFESLGLYLNKLIINLNKKNMSKKVELFAYCLKTKSKELMVDPTISKTAKGGFIAKSLTKDGHKVSLLMSKVNAEAAVASGHKKEGF